MGKSDVYSWRLAPERKAELEEAARSEQIPLAGLLDRIVGEWIERGQHDRGKDQERQARIRARAAKFVGAIHGRQAHRAERARELVRRRLEEKHERTHSARHGRRTGAA